MPNLMRECKCNSSGPKAGRRSGFTLVELIVVIAIMGILAGVGIPAYNGYIRKAHMGVDRQTVGDLIYAAELADYADPFVLSEGEQALIFVTDKGTVAIGDGYPGGIEKSVGSLDKVVLTAKWDGSVDGATVNEMRNSLHDTDAGLNYTDEQGNIAYKDANGNPAAVPYAKKAAELWDLVEDVAAMVADEHALDERTPGEFMALAAQRTVEAVREAGGGAKMGELFQQTNDDNGNIASVIGHGFSGVDPSLAAGEAALMAKNHAFIEYLRTTEAVPDDVLLDLESQEYLDDLANGYINNASNTNYSHDGAGEATKAAREQILAAAQSYVAPKFHYGESEEQVSQAYIDGMIYYALMHNVNRISNPQGDNPPQYDPADPNYMDNIGNYVRVAGNVFSDPGTFAAVTTQMNENSVIGEATSIVNIAVQKIGGRLICTVNPEAADPRDTWDSGAAGGALAEGIPTEAHVPDGSKTSIEGNQIKLKDTDGKEMTEIVSKEDSITIKHKDNAKGGLLAGLNWETAEITSCKINGQPIEAEVGNNGQKTYKLILGESEDVQVKVYQPGHKKIINLIGPNSQKETDDRGDYKINLELTVEDPDGNERVLGPIDYWFIK